jgi:hypothetical protein
MNLAITVCATKRYRYAMRSQAYCIAACLNYAQIVEPPLVVLVGDDSIPEVASEWETILGVPVQTVMLALDDTKGVNYKREAQMRIAAMRRASIHATRGARQVWILDSDVLPPPNALQCMQDMLRFDRGFYDVAFCTYNNGAYMGGYGLPNGSPMAPNVYSDERDIPADLKAETDALSAELKPGVHPTGEQLAKVEALKKRIEDCAPKGNVFERNAKGWRPRGWLEEAYPGVGLGAVVPSAWSGFGCNLLSRRAADMCDWTGYSGDGTEDVFINAFRWGPAGVRIACIAHAPCSHVLRSTKRSDTDPETFTCLSAYHEPGGDSRGHLRTRPIPFTPEFPTT